MSDFKTLVFDDAGTQFAYIDSGAPPNSTDYTTIFAIHGIIFISSIFQKVLDLAPKANLRFVAINRRDYPGSTPLSPEQLGSVTGSDQNKGEYLRDRGLDYLSFIDRFIQSHNLPPVSKDGKYGGVALLGWSLGNSFSLAAIANFAALVPESKGRLAKYLRSLIIQDPPYIALGQSIPPGYWFPAGDESIPLKDRVPFAIQWLTGYFDHGDITKRDISTLSFVIPTSGIIPSVYSLHQHLPEMAFPAALAGSDGLFMSSLGPQLHSNYLKALFDPEIRTLLPHLKVWLATNEMTGSFGIFSLWNIQDDDAKRGGGFVNVEVMPKTNHFVHWDHPEKAVEFYKRAIG